MRKILPLLVYEGEPFTEVLRHTASRSTVWEFVERSKVSRGHLLSASLVLKEQDAPYVTAVEFFTIGFPRKVRR